MPERIHLLHKNAREMQTILKIGQTDPNRTAGLNVLHLLIVIRPGLKRKICFIRQRVSLYLVNTNNVGSRSTGK